MLKELEYVLAVSEHQSISKAAKALFIAQPSLSRYIIELEKKLEVQLFTRTNNRLRLTYAGELYVKTAKNIVNLYDDLENELQEINEAITGRLRIGISSLRLSSRIPELIKSYINKYPMVDVQIYEFSTKEVETLLINNEIDLAISNNYSINPKLSYTSFFSEHILLAVPYSLNLNLNPIHKEGLDYPWIDITALNNAPFIQVGEKQKMYDVAHDVFNKYNVNPKIVVTTGNILSALKLCEVGVGATFILKKMTDINYNEKTMSLYCFGDKRIKWDVCLATKRGTTLIPTANKFATMLEELFLKY